MKLLAFDTSSQRGMVALLENTTLLGIRLFGQQANPLMSEMETLLQELKVDPACLECIAVGVGPGSYTGIRVSGMVAKAFSFAKNTMRLVGLPSLIAWIPEEPGPFAIVVDAKIGGFYLLLGKVKEDGSLEHEPCCVQPVTEALVRLQGIPRIYTPHKGLIEQRLASFFPTIDLTQWQWHEQDPNPVVMARFALKRVEEGDFSKQGELEMLYLRKTQAEIEKEAQTSQIQTQF